MIDVVWGTAHKVNATFSLSSPLLTLDFPFNLPPTQKGGLYLGFFYSSFHQLIVKSGISQDFSL